MKPDTWEEIVKIAAIAADDAALEDIRNHPLAPPVQRTRVAVTAALTHLRNLGLIEVAVTDEDFWSRYATEGFPLTLQRFAESGR